MERNSQITVTNQEELDALPIDYNGRIYVEFGVPGNRAIVYKRYKYLVVARDNSSVEAWDNSSVEARDNSSVVARGNSSVVARDNSSVVARDNSSVVAWNNSSVEAWGNSSVVARGNSQIVDRSNKHNITCSGNARVVYDPTNIAEYIDAYDPSHYDTVVHLYKAVHKTGGRYFSDNDPSFAYTLGKIAVADALDTNPEIGCGHGIHMATKEWCVNYGANWDNLAILEMEAEIKDIIVPLYGVGKVRAPQAKVIREVPLKECGLLGRILAKRRSKENV